MVSANSLEKLVRPARFERATFSSGGEDGEEPTTPDDSSRIDKSALRPARRR